MLKPIAAAVAICASIFAGAVQSEPISFEQSKIDLRQKVYFDQNHSTEGTIYCGCKWTWAGRSGGRIDLDSCGYTPRKDPNRASRLEWEHVVPAWVIGHQRQCWQSGGRENCTETDPVFREMEADMHNLAPSIGEVNADRSNFRYAMLPTTPRQYGACTTKTDFKQRATEPRDEVKGQVARISLYMADRYGMSLSPKQKKLYIAWNNQYPVTDWERLRDHRIARVQGNSNPYVTGHKVATASEEHLPVVRQQKAQDVAQTPGPVIGNRNSHVFHLPDGCPSYTSVSERNRVLFSSEAEAIAAGFRKAGNCRS